MSNTPPLDDDNPAAEEDAADALVEDPTADADIPDEDADNDDEPGANDDPEKELLAPCEDGPLLDAALDVATATEVAPPTLVLACAVALLPPPRDDPALLLDPVPDDTAAPLEDPETPLLLLLLLVSFPVDWGQARQTATHHPPAIRSLMRTCASTMRVTLGPRAQEQHQCQGALHANAGQLPAGVGPSAR